jgi:hypothetical protein
MLIRRMESGFFMSAADAALGRDCWIIDLGFQLGMIRRQAFLGWVEGRAGVGVYNNSCLMMAVQS